MAKFNPIKGNVPFPKGRSGNPRGRPPKLLSTLTKALAEKGYERVSASTIAEVIEYIIGLPRTELINMVDDESIPIAQKIIATHLLSKSDRLRLLMDLLDRTHGKPSLSKDVLLQPVLDNHTPTTIELPGEVTIEI